MKRILLAAILVLALGCSGTPMNVIMTNPETGKSVYISHYSWGYGFGAIGPAIVAEQQQRKAIEAARMMGYTKMREVK